MMPETAAGSTTLMTVVLLRAPKPVLASRSEDGTERSASSETDAISGVTKTPIATPVTSKLVF